MKLVKYQTKEQEQNGWELVTTYDLLYGDKFAINEISSHRKFIKFLNEKSL